MKGIDYPRTPAFKAEMQAELVEVREWYEQARENLREIDAELEGRKEIAAFLDEELKRDPSQRGSYSIQYFQNQEAIQALEQRRKEMEEVRKNTEKWPDIN